MILKFELFIIGSGCKCKSNFVLLVVIYSNYNPTILSFWQKPIQISRVLNLFMKENNQQLVRIIVTVIFYILHSF